jgi:hypothetical protein
MSKGLEYYAYLSEQTIQRLFEQIPKKLLPTIAAELGIDLYFLTIKVTKDKGEQEKALTTQLQAVVAYLEKHQSEQVGTIDNPKMYIKGTLPMFSYFLPQGFGVKESDQPELIYFGGSTNATILGLAGAASYVYVDTNGRMKQVSSSLPFLVNVIAKEYKIIPANSRFRPFRDSTTQALAAMEYMEEYNRQGNQLQNYSFFAKLKLDSQKVSEWRGRGGYRMLLASPLYVAYAD